MEAFVATWRHGKPAQLKAATWVAAVQEALQVGHEDPNRDELITIEWKEGQ
jgi:hypothetical protein